MPVGAGKYDKECTIILHELDAAAVLLMVMEGNRGNGFSVAGDPSRGLWLWDMPRILREVADEIDRSMGTEGKPQ
jgi:hypothetical protein